MFKSKKRAKIIKQIQAMSSQDRASALQAMTADGMNFEVASLMDCARFYSIAGEDNVYTSYGFQVTETYRKYSGESDFGNAQVRGIIDARTAFIAGEGMSIVLGNTSSPGHNELFKKFVNKNKLHSTRIFDVAKQTEMCGYSILTMDKSRGKGDKKDAVPVVVILGNKHGTTLYTPIFENEADITSIAGFNKGKEGSQKRIELNPEQFVYIRTGGTMFEAGAPSTKTGIVLTECDNYDRALKDLRRLNHTCARITPDFRTKSSQETLQLTEWLKKNKWRIGDARIGSAEFSYKVPSTGAHDNLKAEMAAALKTISGATGVPVHWLGWVDMMSNRATAEEMYASVNNATIMERNSIEDGLKELMIKMQSLYINSGGDLITEVIDDFDVQLPLIDFGRFKQQVEAYSRLYSDGVISLQTYRNIVPSVDPLFEESQIDAEEGKELMNKSELPVDFSSSEPGDTVSDEKQKNVEV